MNAARFIDFLKALLDSVPGKVFLIVDGHPVHKAKKVREFAENKTDGRLKIFFLPPYSPDLNPDEMSLPQCELRRSPVPWLPGSLSCEVSIGVQSSVQRRRLW